MFATSWLKYERRIKRQVLQRPLPRNWIPHNDTVTGKIYFIQTRTNEAYTTHPALRSIAPELQRAKERAAIAKYARQAVLHKYIASLEPRRTHVLGTILTRQAGN